MLHDIIAAYGLPANDCQLQTIDSGLINRTWKVTAADKEYVLQQINSDVFKSPHDISENIRKISRFLARHAPGYLFISPIVATSGAYLVQNSAGDFYRLTPFVAGSHTIDTVSTRQEAYEAARQFGRFTSLLSGFDTQELHYTLPNFHNLGLRFEQFKAAYKQASPERLAAAEQSVRDAFSHQGLVQTYQSIKANKDIPLRVIHHDTKISNVLFDEAGKGLCVIDLDTVMPGYFISDVGDMMRTYLSPVNEEEKDLGSISIREDYFAAVMEGYFSDMAKQLTPAEKELCLYAGKFMIYMQALRFLTDFLSGDTYYATSYPKQNLVRTQNQFTLLKRYIEAEDRLQQIISDFLQKEQTSGI
ncbi:aminoglycoside phosphotransferase family protein [Pontibacter saemangeumensis]|uniref:Aminoglycoside phosphotransferase family protein n=1 Tax=Pontibacter saemangeumensis TaxID=1084525 RepID=A0ABP8M3W5_9BACT